MDAWNLKLWAKTVHTIERQCTSIDQGFPQIQSDPSLPAHHTPATWLPGCSVQFGSPCWVESPRSSWSWPNHRRVVSTRLRPPRWSSQSPQWCRTKRSSSSGAFDSGDFPHIVRSRSPTPRSRNRPPVVANTWHSPCQEALPQLSAANFAEHLVLKWLDVGWVSRFVAAHPKVPQVAGKVIFKLRHRMYFGKHLTWFSSMFCGDQRSCALIATTVILSHCFRIPFTGKSGWLTYSNVDGSSLEMPCHEGIWHQCQPKPEWHLPGHVECSTGVHQHHFAHGQSAPPAVLLGHPCFPEDVSKSKPRC